jgi:LacI family transcriptional regulator
MAKPAPVSITEIARTAGVSITTVSRLLNHDDGLKISDETRARILQAADDLGYQANPFAAALRTRRTGLLGALNPNLAGTFHSLLSMALLRESRRRGYDLLVSAPEADSVQMVGQMKRLQSMLFDGLFLLGEMLEYQTTIRRLDLLEKPYVSVCAGTHVPAPLVNIDDEAAISMAVDYLVGLGHRHIAYLGSAEWQQEQARLFYYQQHMRSLGLVAPPEYVVMMRGVTYTPFDVSFQEMWTTAPMNAARALLSLPQPPTAIVCANDGFAIAVLKCALQMGIRVPEELSIIGHNDELPSTLFYPELTTTRQPLDEIAVAALDVLVAMLDGGEAAADKRSAQLLIAPQLVVRGTCMPPTQSDR